MKAAIKRSYYTLLSAFLLSASLDASAAGGLTKAKGLLEKFRDELTTIIPIAATIMLIGFGVAYAAKMMEKDTFVRWAIGIIICGSAAQITALFFS